jgi:hypothetical protein
MKSAGGQASNPFRSLPEFASGSISAAIKLVESRGVDS